MPVTASRPRLHYVVNGSGPPVVFSHGLGLDLHMWDAVFTSIASRWTVVRYDTRSHGRSDPVRAPFTLGDLVDDAVRLIDELKYERVSWVGLSLGGMIGQGLAIRHPERIARLVVANAASTYPEELRRGWFERARTARSDGMPALADLILRRSFSPAFLASGHDAVSRVRQTVLAVDAQGYAAGCEAIASLDYQRQLGQIRCPALVICGDADEPVPVSWAQAITDAIPGAELAVMSGAGHLSAVEYPERFAGLLEGFLREGTPDSQTRQNSLRSAMAETTFWETINAQGNELFAKLKQLVHEGNVRRVAVRQSGRTVAEFPITAGVVGAVFAPALAAIGAIIAIANDCTIEVERAVVDTEPADLRSGER